MLSEKDKVTPLGWSMCTYSVWKGKEPPESESTVSSSGDLGGEKALMFMQDAQWI